MIETLRSAVSKLAALAILVGGIWSIYAFAVTPLTERLTAAEEGLEQQRRLLGHLLAEAHSARLSGTGLQGGLSADDAAFISGGSEASRVALLQSRVAQIASLAGARIGSSRAMAERDQGALRLAGIDVQIAGTIDQLQSVLHALESQNPVLVVETLEIIRSPVAEGAPSGNLDARLVVTGAIKPKQG